MPRNVAQLQGEQYKEYLKSEMQHELQARAHVDQIGTAAANAASSSAMQARAQVEFLENAAAQKILIVQQSASAAEAAANSMVQMARFGTVSVDLRATEAYLKLEQQRTRETYEFRHMMKTMDET